MIQMSLEKPNEKNSHHSLTFAILPAESALLCVLLYLQSLLLIPRLGMWQVISIPSLLAVKSAVTLYSDTSGVSLINVRLSGAGENKTYHGDTNTLLGQSSCTHDHDVNRLNMYIIALIYPKCLSPCITAAILKSLNSKQHIVCYTVPYPTFISRLHVFI